MVAEEQRQNADRSTVAGSQMLSIEYMPTLELLLKAVTYLLILAECLHFRMAMVTRSLSRQTTDAQPTLSSCKTLNARAAQ